MDVEYFQYIVDDNGEEVNAIGFDPEDAAAALFNCKLSDSFSNSSWSTNETVQSSFNLEHNSSMFEALDFSSFTEASPVKTVSDSQTLCCKRYCSPSPPLLSSTPILSTPFYSNIAINKTTIPIPDPMATVRLDHFYTTRIASQNLLSPTKNFSPLLPQFLQTDDTESQVRRYSSRGRPAKSSMEKFIQLCVRGIPGVDRVHWEAELQNNCLKYICKLCSRQFGLAYSLKQHIRFVHMKVRPFPCENCDKKFRSMYDLRRHSTLHTRERFVCVGCGTAYCSKQRVIAHIRKQCLVGNNSTIVTKENEHNQYEIDRSLSSLTLPLDASPLKPQIPDLWC